MKKMWNRIKEVIGKAKTFKNGIPKKIVIDGRDGIETFDQNKVANGFNNFFLLEIVIKELHYVNEWFIANNLSLNSRKTKYLLFYKQSVRGSIPLRLYTITFNSIEIKRESFIKFLGVIIDESITWIKHIELAENKISKNIDILCRTSHYPDKKV